MIQGIKIVTEICLSIVIMGVVEVAALFYLFSHKSKKLHTRKHNKEQQAEDNTQWQESEES